MRLLSIVSIIFVGSVGWTSHAAAPEHKIEEELNDASESEGTWVFKPETSLLFGATSNAPLIQTPTSGAYTKLKPVLTIEYSPSETFLATGSFGGNLKWFPESSVGRLANEYGANARAEFLWYLGDRWELGATSSIAYLDNRAAVVGSSTVEAELQRYYQPDARIYGAFLLESWTVELGASANTRRYTTSTFDIQGNIFNNTYNEIKADARLSHEFSKDTALSLKSSVDQRYYQDRMAEFSDGLPSFPGTALPTLSTRAHEHETQIKYRILSLKLATTLGVRLEKDLVYGARDSTKIKFQQKVSIPLPYRFSMEPHVSVARQNFSNFRSDPINNPQNSSLRLDWEQQVATPIKFQINKGMIAQVQYSFNNKSSNYTLQNYTEHVVETGLNVNF